MATDEQQQQSRITGQLILVEGGPEVPQSILLQEKDIVIGRGCGCDVTLGSLQISRRHATLEYINNKWFIRDASTNGISIGTRDSQMPTGFNSQRLTKNVNHELKDRDLIHLIPTGSLIYRYELPTSTSAASPNLIAPETKTEPQEVVNVEDDRVPLPDENSNQSQSLLSLSGNPMEDYFDNFGLEALIAMPIHEVPGCSKSSSKDSFPLGKRKPGELTELDRELEGQIDKKKKRRFREERLGEDFMDNEAIYENGVFSGPIVIGDSSSDESSNEDLTENSIDNCIDLKQMRNKYLKLYKKFKLAHADVQTLKFEKTIEKEEYLQKQNDVQSRTEAYKEELFKQILEVMEHEFNCCICNEIFVFPTVVDCGHTFCNFCIGEWTRKKPECPICRKYIRNQTKHVEMDNYITKLHTLLSEEIRIKRDQAVAERTIEKEKAAVKAAAEARGRRGGVPNADYAGFPFPQGDRIPIPFDLLAELQSINDHPWPPPPAHNANNGASAVAAANAANASAAAQRRSARIQGRPQTGRVDRAPASSRRGGRYTGRDARMELLGMNNPMPRTSALDEVLGGLRDFDQVARVQPPQNNVQGVQNPQQQPQPGSSRSMNALFFAPPPNAGGMPQYLEGPRQHFFPMFPFGGMGRHENRANPQAQPLVQQTPNPNNPSNLLDVLLVD